MKFMKLSQLPVFLSTLLLASCGGGGGDPGDCKSDAVYCTEFSERNSVAPAIVTPTASGDTDATCPTFTWQQDAQAAYLAGARQLDGDNDGIACEDRPGKPA